MPYQVTLADGSVITNLADNTVDNTTSLTLVGRNYPGYGGLIANNFVRLLQNSANTQSPAAPLQGQLWYDTTPDSDGNLFMKVWTGSEWFPLTAGVSSVLNATGAIALSDLVAGGVAPILSPQFQGVPTGPTAAAGTASNQLATTQFVVNQVGTLIGGVSSVVGNSGSVTLANLVQGGLAPIGSPSFSGTPTAPTPAVGSNNNQIATTAYVINEVGSLSTGCSSVLGNSGNVTLAQMVTAGLAPIKSPQFQGVPVAPTAATGTNTNQIATCAFVLSSIPTVTAITGATGATGAQGPQGAPGITVPVRTLLTGNITFYVSPSGNDTTGAGTQASPFATMQHAYNVLMASYDGCGYNATIGLMNGTHASGLTLAGSLVGFPNGVAIQGFGAVQGAPGTANTSAAVVVAVPNGNAFTAYSNAQFSVAGFTIGNLTGTDTYTQQSGNGISCNLGAFCNIGAGMIFGSCSAYHILVQGGYVGGANSYQITGGALGHMYVCDMGYCVLNGYANSMVVTLTGTPAFGQYFINANNNAFINVPGLTFTGAATGPKFNVGYCSFISTNGAGINYFPGSVAGNIGTTTSGYYV